MGDAPLKPIVPSGPVIREASGTKAPARTYQDLLKSTYDTACFEYYFQAQVMKVSLDGSSEPIGKSGIIRRIDPSPGGNLHEC